MREFSVLKLNSELLANLTSLNYKKMTDVQNLALPEALSGKDIIVQAKTGSGKTAVFALNILQKIDVKSLYIQALILCPTRELGDQVSNVIRTLARTMSNVKVLTLCGGSKVRVQAESLEHGAHIIVGTPGRIKDHLGRKTIKLGKVKFFVLDEADRMLDMGFTDDIHDIETALPKQRQSMLFSATYPKSIKSMAKIILSKPIEIKVETESDFGNIDQRFYKIKHNQRQAGTLALLGMTSISSAVVFCTTKQDCRELHMFLKSKNIESLALHGDLDQSDRNQILLQFANRSCVVLVATDVAARGLDIESIDMVINYELPHDPEVYVHRIGRTGRANESGLAASLFSDDDISRIVDIENYQNSSCNYYDLPKLKDNLSLRANMQTIRLSIGKKNKLRPGDLLGALTGDGKLTFKQIGKIKITARDSYVAIEKTVIGKALNFFKTGKVKGKSVRGFLLKND